MPALTVRPVEGGKLITRAAAADAGVPHYTSKFNWRRDLTDEIVREGHDYFLPIGLTDDYLIHPFPGTDDPITLVHLVRRPNGDACLIAGTKTTLYAFRFDLRGYVENPPLYADGLFDGPNGSNQPYFEQRQRWQVIGSGFSPNGRRWEWSDIDGTTTMNNSVDLPVAFRVEWDRVKPLYELREQGVVSVGTIADVDGILVCGDITDLRDTQIDAVLKVQNSGAVTIAQEGYKTGVGTSTGTVISTPNVTFNPNDVGRLVVWSTGVQQRIVAYTSANQVTLQAAIPAAVYTAAKTFRVTDAITDGWPSSAPYTSWTAYGLVASANFFTPQMVGRTITWANGASRRILAYISPTLVRTDIDTPISSGSVNYENPNAYLSSEQLAANGVLEFDRRQYRTIWSELNQPTRWGALHQASFVSGTKVVTLKYACRSIEELEVINVIGAGVAGGVLTNAVISSIGPGRLTIDRNILTTGAGQVQRSVSYASITGYEDLQDDGSGILKMAQLAGRLVIYKDTNIFVARFTGQSDRPFLFERIVVPHGRSLYFRNTLVSLQDVSHVYAGKDRFYRFDLTTRQPQPVNDADLMSNTFFDTARLADTETIYAVDNHLSQEAWIVSPSGPTICFDYLYATFSTTDVKPSGAATVKSASYPLVAESGEWFLMGTSNGVMLMYGLATEPMAHWMRQSPETWEDGKRIYYRRSDKPFSTTKSGYTSTLSGGLMHFGDMTNEKHIERYTLGLSSQPQAQGNTQPYLSVTFWQAINQNAVQYPLGTVAIPDAENHGMIPLHCISHYFRDEVGVSVLDNPARMHNRTFQYTVIGSRSHHRA